MNEILSYKKTCLLGFLLLFLTGFYVNAQTTELVMSPTEKSSLNSIIWEDDFEDGSSLRSRYDDISTTGLAVTQNEVFDGSYSLEQSYTTGQQDAGWICKVNNEGYPDHIFMRWYHKYEEGFEGFPPKMARIRSRDRDTWEKKYSVYCWVEGANGEVVLQAAGINSSQANSSGFLPNAHSGYYLADKLGDWICFEMEVKVNTSGMTDGLYRLWINDELKVERLNVDLRGNTDDKTNELMLDAYFNAGSPKEQSRYFDDLVISKNKIGMKCPD